MMTLLWLWLTIVVLGFLNLFQARWFIIRTIMKVPVPDNGSWGYITTDPQFQETVVNALAGVGDPPLCTANSETNPALKRVLWTDGTLVNSDDNKEFLETLGNPKAFRAKVSSEPKRDAERLSQALKLRGYKTFVVEHYAPEMKGKMYFISFRDSKYNPGWVFAFRLRGDKLGPTSPW